MKLWRFSRSRFTAPAAASSALSPHFQPSQPPPRPSAPTSHPIRYDESKENLEGEVHGPCRRPPCSDALDADLSSIGWAWLQHACQTANALPFKTCQLWAGHGGGVTPCHYDSLSNFLAQLQGKKSILLFPPSETFNLYPYP